MQLLLVPPAVRCRPPFLVLPTPCVTNLDPYMPVSFAFSLPLYIPHIVNLHDLINSSYVLILHELNILILSVYLSVSFSLSLFFSLFPSNSVPPSCSVSHSQAFYFCRPTRYPSFHIFTMQYTALSFSSAIPHQPFPALLLTCSFCAHSLLDYMCYLPLSRSLFPSEAVAP